MEIYQEVLKIKVRGDKPCCVNITKLVQRIVSNFSLTDGIVLVHTRHTTTGLIGTTGLLVQEKEPLLLEDFGEMLNEGAERFLRMLPQIAAGRERFLNYVPEKLLDILLRTIIAILRPTERFEHDDLLRRINISPNERKNAVAHLEAAMLRESFLWSFSGGKLNLGKWQSMLFWDFDPKGRKERCIQVVVIGKK